jgi:hypothetical protein
MAGNRNRTAGHNFERECVRAFKEIGFQHVETSRLVNLSRDSDGIDLANKDELKNGRFPYNMQCKNMSTAVPYIKLLTELPNTNCINVIAHKKTERKGDKFYPAGKYAFMHLKDFFGMVDKIEFYKARIAELEKLTKEQKTKKNNGKISPN